MSIKNKRRFLAFAEMCGVCVFRNKTKQTKMNEHIICPSPNRGRCLPSRSSPRTKPKPKFSIQNFRDEKSLRSTIWATLSNFGNKKKKNDTFHLSIIKINVIGTRVAFSILPIYAQKPCFRNKQGFSLLLRCKINTTLHCESRLERFRFA